MDTAEQPGTPPASMPSEPRKQQLPEDTQEAAPACESTPSGENSAPEWSREIGQVVVDGLNRMRTHEAYRLEIASRAK